MISKSERENIPICTYCIRVIRTPFQKENTFILDFFNSTEEIVTSFAPYFQATSIEEVTDPNIVFDMLYLMKAIHVYLDEEVERVTELFLKNINLYKLQVYLVRLLKKLPKDSIASKLELDEMLNLDYYKIKQIAGEGNKGADISMGTDVVAEPLPGFTAGGASQKKEEELEYLDDIDV